MTLHTRWEVPIDRYEEENLLNQRIKLLMKGKDSVIFSVRNFCRYLAIIM